jgi:ABC-type antimicrobial peptide transport system permease subunit
MNNETTQTRTNLRLRLLIWLSAKNLLAKRLRSFLTVFGIIIGLGSIAFLVSLALGLHNVVNQQVIGSKSVKTVDVTSPNSTVIRINQTNLQKITQLANVTSVGRAYILPGKIAYQGSQSDTVVYGVDSTYLSLDTLKVVNGVGSLAASHDVIVNSALLNLIGLTRPSQAIGHSLAVQVAIANQTTGKTASSTFRLTIKGVVSTGSGAEVYMQSQPLAQAGASDYNQLKVVMANQNQVSTVRQQIEGLGLTTTSPLDTLNEINTVFKFFTIIVIGFGGIGMLIAALGMFNTLTISLLERTSEIGLMISLGARRADIQRLLIVEALLLSVVGGLVGLVLAWLLGWVIDLFLSHLATSHGLSSSVAIFSVTFAVVLGIFALAIVLGLLVAFYPARRAARINLVDALRHEA